jgi:hypothetical protein
MATLFFLLGIAGALLLHDAAVGELAGNPLGVKCAARLEFPPRPRKTN